MTDAEIRALPDAAWRVYRRTVMAHGTFTEIATRLRDWDRRGLNRWIPPTAEDQPLVSDVQREYYRRTGKIIFTDGTTHD